MSGLGDSWTYRSNSMISGVSSSILDGQFLIRLFHILEEMTKQALDRELAQIDSMRSSGVLASVSEEDYNIYKKDVSENSKVHVEITGSRGEFFASDDVALFNTEVLPDRIVRVSFDNSFFYKVKFNRDPVCNFKVVLDFSKPPILDLFRNPSLPTKNDSMIHVFGVEESWVEGFHSKLLSEFRDRRSARGWFHRSHIYDVFLWFIMMPLTFWNLYKVERALSPQLASVSPVFIAAFYLFVFIFLLNLFRLLFYYIRWLFPFLEFKAPGDALHKLHRAVATTVAIGIVSAVAYDGLKVLFHLLIR